MREEIWTDKTGKDWPVGDMKESHVKNVLRMILRHRRESNQPVGVWFESMDWACDATEADIY